MKPKQRKSKKPTARKATAARTPSKKQAQASAQQPVAQAQEAPQRPFPRVVHIAKAGDAIAVTVTSAEHLRRLVDEHGHASVKEAS